MWMQIAEGFSGGCLWNPLIIEEKASQRCIQIEEKIEETLCIGKGLEPCFFQRERVNGTKALERIIFFLIVMMSPRKLRPDKVRVEPWIFCGTRPDKRSQG